MNLDFCWGRVALSWAERRFDDMPPPRAVHRSATST
eukprot:CAMPEP_0115301764 /NCGR_PEP_ID=MMETSP0270-20121206/70030_1 /TAXON_ID=71861 /ORGANISM="Scrippsiella trochoidea, Strain CCMP3099" /LENGTH=35 /DNA_ID= /DNA_START= /DNA_END= /DNA_ORIENTATION=